MKGGADCMMSATTVAPRSSLPPRRQPITMPSVMPMAKVSASPAIISSMVFQKR